MIGSITFLKLALALATLSYYTGVLILVLPIPVKGLKRWGSRLIVDGLYVTVLSFILSSIYQLVDAFFGGMDKGFAEALNAIRNKYAETLAVYLVAKSVAAALSRITFRISTSFIGVYASMLATVLSILNVLVVLLVLGFLGRDVLTSLGLMLMGLPFRIGRSAGAALIAFALTSSILLPLFPQWLKLIATLTPLPGSAAKSLGEENRFFLAICLKSAYGHPSLLVVKFESDRASYLFTGRGDCVYIIRPSAGVPGGNYTLYVSSYGITVVRKHVDIPRDLKPLPFRGLIDYYLEVKAPDTVYLNDKLLLVVTGCKLSSLRVTSLGDYTYRISCSTNDTAWFIFGYPHGCRLDIFIERDKYKVVRSNTYSINWYGVQSDIRTLYVISTIGSVEFKAKFDYKSCPSNLKLKVGEQLRLEDLFELPNLDEILSNIVFGLTWYFAQNFVAVLSYVALLVMLTHGLAKALGASYVRFPFPI